MREPRDDHKMMTAEGPTLDARLQRSLRQHAAPAGVSFKCFTGGVPALAAAGLLEGLRGLGGRVYATQRWRRQGERPTCLYNNRANRNTMFVVAVRTQATAREDVPRQALAEQDGGASGGGTGRDDDDTTGRDAGTDDAGRSGRTSGGASASGARKRAPHDEGDERRKRGAARGDGGDDEGDDERDGDKEPSGQNADEEDTNERAAAPAAAEQAAPPTEGQSILSGARARTGQVLEGAMSAVGGMLRRASSWWRKRQRAVDDDGPDETRKRTKGDG